MHDDPCPPSSWHARLAGAALLIAGGCQGTLGDPDGSSGNPPVNPPNNPSCSPTADPLRRLTVNEYRNTVAELFPGVTLPTQLPIDDERIGGFIGQADGQSVSAIGVQRYAELAETIGESAATSLASWAPCTEDTALCTQQIATTLGARAYRRPLEDEEVTALEAFAAETHADFGGEAAVALVVQALLESPFFLFRPELGSPGDGDVVALTDYEMASRLSYFFLDSMPDDELFEAAAEGRLTNDDDLAAEVLRLIEDERARPVLTGFFAEWLRLYKLDELALDPTAFPEFDEAMRLDLDASVRLYLEKALWEDDAWSSLIRGDFGFVNDRLAPVFGVPAPGTEELTLTTLDGAERRGILTQPGLLASTSHGIAHSPIYRGVTVLESILCNDIPAPPPGILDNLEEVELPPGEVCTTRDRVAKTHSVGEGCDACHILIDGAGFAFENYDGLGRYRTMENGCEVDASGSFTVGEIGDVDDAVDLADALATNARPRECMATHLLRYASGRDEAQGDTCEIQALAVAMEESDSLQDTILRLVLSDAFRNRPAL